MTQKSKGELWMFYKAAAASLVRAEAKSKVAERFYGDGFKRWVQFANELDKADLLDLAIRDAGSPYPIPFGLRKIIGGYSDREIGINASEAEDLIVSCQGVADLTVDRYIAVQVESLGIDMFPIAIADSLPCPQAHHTILECPGTGGMLSYLITKNSNTQLYYWENFYIICSNWREAMLAGLIAFELDAPPNIDLQILIDESMSLALKNDKYDWIVGKRDGNEHRSLKGFVLQDNGAILI